MFRSIDEHTYKFIQQRDNLIAEYMITIMLYSLLYEKDMSPELMIGNCHFYLLTGANA